jgi:hypothetical protein
MNRLAERGARQVLWNAEFSVREPLGPYPALVHATVEIDYSSTP